MNLQDFRINHSILIEHYQFIEAHLEGIYAAISEKDLLNGLHDVENDNMYRILKLIKKIEKEKNLSIFTPEEYAQLDKIFRRRNFWCHNCYYDMVFDIKTDGPRNANDIKTMISDLKEAEIIREELYKKQMDLFNKNKDTLLYYL